MKIKLGDRRIGENEPCFIIAEAGVNHNGDLGIAKKLIGAAADSGADAIKFQAFKTESLVTKTAGKASYQKADRKCESQFEMLRKLELPMEGFAQLKRYCDERGIIFLSSPHTEDAIKILDALVPAYKIGSGDLTNLPFLENIAKMGKPLILGTGMASMGEVKEALRTIKRAGNSKVVMLHCTTSYPCPLSEVNMAAMTTMMAELGCLVGYSDHTNGDLAPIMARALGAVVLEKHFTLDRDMPGPDHKASMEPPEFKSMVAKIRECEIAMGGKEKLPTASEREMAKYVRKSIVARADIRAGQKLSNANLIIKRPGTGMPPKEISRVLGRVAKGPIKKDELIKRSDLK